MKPINPENLTLESVAGIAYMPVEELHDSDCKCEDCRKTRMEPIEDML